MCTYLFVFGTGPERDKVLTFRASGVQQGPPETTDLYHFLSIIHTHAYIIMRYVTGRRQMVKMVAKEDSYFQIPTASGCLS